VKVTVSHQSDKNGSFQLV